MNFFPSLRGARGSVALLALLAGALTLASCTTVHLIAEYDKKLDDGLMALQRKTETFLVKLERGVETPESAYSRHQDFYDEVKVDLSALKVRADALAANALTAGQIELLQDSFQKLEEQHQRGIKRAMIESLRRSFNSQFTAILKLEIAKKRE